MEIAGCKHYTFEKFEQTVTEEKVKDLRTIKLGNVGDVYVEFHGEEANRNLKHKYKDALASFLNGQEVESYCGTAEAFQLSLGLGRIKNAHWEIMLYCADKKSDCNYIVNCNFGAAPNNIIMQDRGLLSVQVIEEEQLKKAIDLGSKLWKDFISRTTTKRLIPSKKFLDDLKQKFHENELPHHDHEVDLWELIEKLRGHDYSIFAHTNPSDTVDNCQTMTRKIKDYCEGTGRIGNCSHENTRGLKWFGKKCVRALSYTMNLTILYPLIRGLKARCSDEKLAEMGFLKKEKYDIVLGEKHKLLEQQVGDFDKTKDILDGPELPGSIEFLEEQKQMEPSTTRWESISETELSEMTWINDDLVNEDYSLEFSISDTDTTSHGPYPDATLSECPTLRRRLVTLEKMIEL